MAKKNEKKKGFFGKLVSNLDKKIEEKAKKGKCCCCCGDNSK